MLDICLLKKTCYHWLLISELQHLCSIAICFSSFQFCFAVTKCCLSFPFCMAALEAHYGALWVQCEYCLILSKQQGLANSSVNYIPVGLGATLRKSFSEPLCFVIGGSVLSPKWLFCCCDRWKRVVRWGLSSSPSLGAGSSAPFCAEIWGSCKETAEETVGWRMCPLQPFAPGCCWLPETVKETLFFQFYLNKKLQPNMDDCNDEIYLHLCW